jgi:hypothetical protein
MDERADVLLKARDERSRQKRLAVEQAISHLKETGEPITFKAVSKIARVSRQYLYNNFREEIGGERDAVREITQTIDGVKVPIRTPEEARHIEALLRNKIARLEKDLNDSRKKLQSATDLLERERGKSEYWREQYTKARTQLRGT